MIKYESIISSFDDKDTLYNWLRKVEEQLKNASATGFVVNKKGNATLSFSITFADGTTLESGDIVLQQGESVDDARIASGVLQLHLTNGTWLTAGNIKPVSNFSIDANQHLIVNYQDGTSQDLGAIFNGNITINGTLETTASIDVGGNVNVTGNVNCAGASFTGDIEANNVTANSIIETMTGYSYESAINEVNIQVTPIYVGAVKTGNKLTLVVFTSIKRIGEVSSNIVDLGKMVLPLSVANKIYPFSAQKVAAVNVALTGSENLYVEVYKNAPTKLSYGAYGVNTKLTLDTTYMCRVELTFLLSDNLAE